ncbi:MAG: DUF5723 family protein [Bacteroidota bacterium]
MMKRLLFILMLSYGSLSLFAQPEAGLWFLPEVSQANQLNPAFTGNQSLVIGIPAMSGSFSLMNSTFPVQQAFVGPVDQRLNLENEIAALQGDQFLRSWADVRLLEVGFKVRKTQIGISSHLKMLGHSRYSSDFVKLLWFGNGNLIDETIQLTPDFQLMAYQDFAARISVPVGEKLRIGGRLHYLLGVGDLSVGNNTFTLYTDPAFYQLTIDADYEVRASNSISSLPNQLSAVPNWFNAANGGLAIDLGAEFRPMKNVSIGASLLNFGFINWRQNAQIWKSEGIIEYNGLTLGSWVRDQQFTAADYIDSLEAVFSPIQRQESYTTSLPLRLIVGGSWEPMEWLRVGALFEQESFRGQNFQVIALHGALRHKDIASFGLTYSHLPRFGSQLGTQLMFRAGPVQLLASTNNVLTAFQYWKGRSAQFRLGLNFAIGEGQFWEENAAATPSMPY